jgi:hypothetical protein
VDRQALVAALRAVRGVVDADVDPDDAGGLGTLRLDLEPGVDEVAVADQVSRVLRERFGLGVDSDRVELLEVDQEETEEVIEQPPAAPTAPTAAPAAAKPAATATATAPSTETTRPEPAAAPTPPPAAATPPPAAATPPPAAAPAPEPRPAPEVPAASVGTPVADAAWAASVEDVAETRSVTMPIPQATTRPALVKMHLVSAGFDVTANVTLAAQGRVAVGQAQGMASPTGVHRAVATATLRAVERLVGSAVRVELEHLEVASMGSERTVVVLLTMLSDRGTEPLTGAAAVRDDVRQAVIRATLDALNRRLELLLGRE